MEENFLLLFRFDNPLESSVEFMKVGRAGQGRAGQGRTGQGRAVVLKLSKMGQNV